MGQYYLVCNLDKEEYIHPHKFGDGMKLMEFGDSASGTMLGLAVLLADGNGRGGGDLFSARHKEELKECREGKRKWEDIDWSRAGVEIAGRWAGDRIVIAGDYADDGKFLTQEQIDRYLRENPEDAKHLREYNRTAPNLFEYAERYFRDISDEVIAQIAEAEPDHPLAKMWTDEWGIRWRGGKPPITLRPDMVIKA